MVKFPTSAFGEKPDFSNLNITDWIPRTKAQCQEIGKKHRNSKTAQEQKHLEREFGIRYSVLSDLPYFDLPRMCIIDPMHNLLLGTAKHVLEIWKTLNILSPADFDTIQERVNGFITPSDIRRLPGKISSGFSAFTAEQWRNWTMYYSLVSLKDMIPHAHYNCWKLFVQACFLFCRRSLSIDQVREANALIMQFLQSFLQLYGSTPNMHLHGHLHECIYDYGPVYSFWLFAFEHLNGVLGSYNTNCHHISV